MSPAADAPQREVVVALAGQPNVGKSTIFNLLTGLSQHVGNWPGKTVERREGTLVRDGVRLRIVDLPGTYSLSANSEEERIARDFIIKECPDVVVMIANAAALERSLYLLAELLILPVPLVLGLNMMDVAADQGIEIAPHVLAAALGLPVVPLTANRNEGVSELIAAAVTLARAPDAFRPARPQIAAPHREVLAQVRALLGAYVPQPYGPDWVALKLLEGDAEITALARRWLPPGAWQPIATLLAQHEDAVLAFLTPVFFGRGAFAVALGLVALNLLVLALLGIVLNRTLFRGQHAAFIMELPLYHAPSVRTLGLFAWQNLWAFVRRAGTLILLASVAVWALASFPGPAIETSYLARFGLWLAPLGQLMGMDWRLLVALLSSFLAKENAIATLGILYGGEESPHGLAATLAAAVPPAAGLAFLVVTMLFIPCVATVAVMRQETRRWRWALLSVLLLLALALAAGIGVYQAARWLGIGVGHA